MLIILFLLLIPATPLLNKQTTLPQKNDKIHEIWCEGGSRYGVMCPPKLTCLYYKCTGTLSVSTVCAYDQECAPPNYCKMNRKGESLCAPIPAPVNSSTLPLQTLSGKPIDIAILNFLCLRDKDCPTEFICITDFNWAVFNGVMRNPFCMNRRDARKLA